MPIRCADRSDSAPVTSMRMNLLAPSPSRTTRCASCRQRSSSAARNASAPGEAASTNGVFTAVPVANASTVSLVDVSLSTVMHEKLARFASARAFCRKAGSTAASVKMKPSIVAMSGAIMPDPLMMPTRFTRVLPTNALVAAPLGKVSVVPMVRAASSQPAGGAVKAASSPASALGTGSAVPITPVEATNTSVGAQPRCPATRATIASTATRPRAPVKAFALPALTTSARARPLLSAARHHSTSGEGHLLDVVTPATVVPGVNSAKVRSQRPHSL